MKLFRRLVSLCLAAVLILSFSVTAFAAQVSFIDISDVPPTLGFFTKSFQPVPGSDGDYSLDVKLALAEEEAQQTWRECLRGLDSGDMVAVFRQSGSSVQGDFTVCFFPDREISSPNTEIGYYFLSTGKISIKAYHFSFVNSGGSVSFSSFKRATASFSSSSISYSLYSSDTDFFLRHVDTLPSSVILAGGIRSLRITDDLEPQPEPEPEPPEPPQGGKYVLYDVSVWEGFLSRIRGSVGASASTGILLLAIILGISLAIRIVRWFAGG